MQPLVAAARWAAGPAWNIALANHDIFPLGEDCAHGGRGFGRGVTVLSKKYRVPSTAWLEAARARTLPIKRVEENLLTTEELELQSASAHWKHPCDLIGMRLQEGLSVGPVENWFKTPTSRADRLPVGVHVNDGFQVRNLQHAVLFHGSFCNFRGCIFRHAPTKIRHFLAYSYQLYEIITIVPNEINPSKKQLFEPTKKEAYLANRLGSNPPPRIPITTRMTLCF